MIHKILSVVILMLLISSCDMDSIEGQGDLKTETRVLKLFTKIKLDIDAHVIITKDSIQSVRIEAQPNILKVLTTDISNGELNISREERISDYKAITVYISMPNIEGVDVSGSGSVETRGTFSPDKIDLSISGSGTISATLSANEAAADIIGSGSLNLNGSARKFNVDIIGSGDVNAQDFPSQNCEVSVQGSGNSRVFAISKLKVDIQGSGNVYYKGKPDISNSISGSGKLEKSN